MNSVKRCDFRWRIAYVVKYVYTVRDLAFQRKYVIRLSSQQLHATLSSVTQTEVEISVSDDRPVHHTDEIPHVLKI